MIDTDGKIKALLDSHNMEYEPYRYSLVDKLNWASEIKTIINKDFPIEVQPSFTEATKSRSKVLLDQGIVQFETPFFSAEQLNDIDAFLKKEKAYPAHVAYYDKQHPIDDPYNFKGKIASFNADTIVRAPHLIELLSSKEIIDVVTTHLGATPTLFDLNLIFSFGDTEAYHETHHFHRDHDDFHHCLLMVYLSDVDEECGGHLYARGSHKTGNQSSELRPVLSDNNSVKDTLVQEDDFNLQLVLGKKGTGFISDANGLHSGSVPKQGKRRAIFWARFGLTKNYMWKVHNHRSWGFSPTLFSEKIDQSVLHRSHIFRLFTTPYNQEEFQESTTIGDSCMRKTSKFGWNICVHGNNYYAMKQSEGDIKIDALVGRDDSIAEATSKLQNYDILIDTNEERLLSRVIERGYSQPTLLEEGFYQYNLVGYKTMVYGIPPSAGSVNLEQLKAGDPAWRMISRASTLEELKKNITKQKHKKGIALSIKSMLKHLLQKEKA